MILDHMLSKQEIIVLDGAIVGHILAMVGELPDAIGPRRSVSGSSKEAQYGEA